MPEALSRVLAEVNARAKNCVEAGAERFLAENRYQPAAGADEKLPIRYRNLSYIVNVTRADDILFSILETEMESGIGDAEGIWLRAPESCRFRSAVYDTASGRELTLSDFLKDDSPERVRERLEQALSNKYGSVRPAGDGETALPAWTADHLGLRFYLDGTKDSRKAFHVSLPYTELDGAFAKTAAGTPESFIAQLEKNRDYALPHDSRVIRIEKAVDEAGLEIEDVRITTLAYAEEIAAAMLQRQQAVAIIAARQKIVEGAVGMVKMAIDQLNEDDVVMLDEERKAAMVSNLLVVLCGNKDAQPIVNSGSIY